MTLKTYTNAELDVLWSRCCANEPLTGEELNALKHDEWQRADARNNEFEDFRTKCEFEYVPSRPLARQGELNDFEKQVSVVRIAVTIVTAVVLGALISVML